MKISREGNDADWYILATFAFEIKNNRQMRILKPKYEILPQGSGMDGIYKQIELCGRTCYASSMRIEHGSAKPFVERMVKSGHNAMCEHGSVYLKAEYHKDFAMNATLVKRYQKNQFSKVNVIGDYAYISTNYRVLVENGLFDDLDFICEPTEWHEKRVTVRFTTQIAVSREANRHRADSIAEQSTRYCNYSKDKFGNEMSINEPKWVCESGVDLNCLDESDFELLVRHFETFKAWSPIEKWWFANKMCEKTYLSLVEDDGLKPQDARVVLPLDANTELIHTAFVSDWKHFFDLRAKGTTGKPHPDIEVLATPLMSEFEKMGLI